MWRHPFDGPAPKTQEARGLQYARDLKALFGPTSTRTHSHNFIGLLWWIWVDNPGEQANWGLVTTSDNAYDGVESTISRGVDPWGFATGGEERNYGNFIGAARVANYGLVEQLDEELKH